MYTHSHSLSRFRLSNNKTRITKKHTCSFNSFVHLCRHTIVSDCHNRIEILVEILRLMLFVPFYVLALVARVCVCVVFCHSLRLYQNVLVCACFFNIILLLLLFMMCYVRMCEYVRFEHVCVCVCACLRLCEKVQICQTRHRINIDNAHMFVFITH